MFSEEIHLRLSARQCNSQLQACKREKKMTPAIIQLRRTHSHGSPELVVKIRKMKAGRHHTYDRVAIAVEADLLAEYFCTGPESVSPKAVANYQYVRVAGTIYSRRKYT